MSVPAETLSIPLTPVAGRWLQALARMSGSPALAALDAATLLGERAVLQGFRIPGRVAAGGGCRFYTACDGELALQLSRPSDHELLPAWLEADETVTSDAASLAALIAARPVAELVERGRVLGLALAAAATETSQLPAASTLLLAGYERRTALPRAPRVVDLSSLWAGPLCAQLLSMAGAEVIKLESRQRPDPTRDGMPAFHARLNQHKASVVLDFSDREQIAALRRLCASADIVIEASRPRALAQLGIDAAALVRDTPGLVWLSLTAHGVDGDAANAIGFGDDCGVAGGLSAALRRAGGTLGFVGDAIADPLSGIYAAYCVWQQWQRGQGARIGVAMTGVVAEAVHDARLNDAAAFDASLRNWRANVGAAFPSVRTRSAGKVAAFGADTATVLGELGPC